MSSGPPAGMLDTARRVIATATLAVAGVLLVVLFAVVILQVVTRSVFDSPIVWTEEVARYLLIWVTLLGCVWAAHGRHHVGLALGRVATGGRLDRVVTRIGEAATLVVLAFVAYVGITALPSFGASSPALGLALTWVYLAFPVGMTLWALVELFALVKEARR